MNIFSARATSLRHTTLTALTAVSLLSGGIWSASAQANLPAPAPGQPTFLHPTAITNPYLPLASLRRDVLTGTDGGKPSRTERTVLPGTRIFHINGQSVAAMVVEDRDYTNGELAEATRDYFAQSDDGTVYYLGESVDEYRHGKIVGHGGAWLTGEANAKPGVMMKAHPKVGDTWQSEAVPGVAVERDQVVSVDATVTVPAGTYHSCVKVKEMVPGEGAEYKYYAPHVGVVEEAPVGGTMRLKSHQGLPTGRKSSDVIPLVRRSCRARLLRHPHALGLRLQLVDGLEEAMPYA